MTLQDMAFEKIKKRILAAAEKGASFILIEKFDECSVVLEKFKQLGFEIEMGNEPDTYACINWYEDEITLEQMIVSKNFYARTCLVTRWVKEEKQLEFSREL